MSNNLINIKQELRRQAVKKDAVILASFFKTGQGEYGQGDIFLGVKIPKIRKIAKDYRHISLSDLVRLLKSKVHEDRLLSLLIFVLKYSDGDDLAREKIFKIYLSNTKFINNWDLVDLTAPNIVGDFLVSRDKTILYMLANSKMLWERRIAVLATFTFIKKNMFKHTLKISKMLLADDHDLIHKAVGWMLREVGKRDILVEEEFLKKHYRIMPRTMLRYAIEKFPEKLRQEYLKGKI